MSKSKFWCIIFLFSLNSLAVSQEKTDAPYWVREFKPENTDDYFYGVGLSEKSSELADNDAYLKFAKMIKVSVNAESKRTLKENMLGIFDSWSESSSVKTNEDFSGIDISERYKDSAIYFSLVHIHKEKYFELKKQGIKTDAELNASKLESEATLERAKLTSEAELKKTKMETEASVDNVEQRIKAEKEQTKQARRALKERAKLLTASTNQQPETRPPVYSSVDLARARKAELEAERDRAAVNQLKRQNKARRAADRQRKKSNRPSRYQHFARISPPRTLITFRNAQLIKETQEISMGIGIDPFAFEEISYTYRLWSTETSLKMEFVDNQLKWQEATFRIRVLPLTEGYYRTSIGIGVVEYLSQVAKTDSKLWRPKYSPMVAGHIAIPHLFHSYFSFYGDYRKISMGLNSFLFFNGTGDSFNFITQVDFIQDEDYINRFEEDVIFSAGFQFKATDYITTTISYEDHEIFVLRFGYEF